MISVCARNLRKSLPMDRTLVFSLLEAHLLRKSNYYTSNSSFLREIVSSVIDNIIVVAINFYLILKQNSHKFKFTSPPLRALNLIGHSIGREFSIYH